MRRLGDRSPSLMGLTDFGYDATVSRPRITIVSIWASSDEVVDITYAVPTFRSSTTS